MLVIVEYFDGTSRKFNCDGILFDNYNKTIVLDDGWLVIREECVVSIRIRRVNNVE